MGRSIPRLNFEIAAKDIIAAPSAKIALDGVIGAKPAKGDLTFSAAPIRHGTSAAENLSIGSVALSGSGALSAERLLDGAFQLRAGDLDDLTPLALQKLAGKLDGQFSFSSADGKQAGAVQLKASGLRAEAASIERLDIDIKGSDMLAAPRLDGTAALDRAAFGGETIPRLRFAAKSAGEASDFTLSTEARGVQIESKGRLFASKPLRVDLAAFEAKGAGQRISLAGPARFSFPDGGVEIRGLSLASGAGRLNVDGKAGETLDLTLNAKGLPLSLAKLAEPALAFDGALDAAARIGGKASAPTGDWRFELAKFSSTQLRAAGIGALGLQRLGQAARRPHQHQRGAQSAAQWVGADRRLASALATGAMDVTCALHWTRRSPMSRWPTADAASRENSRSTRARKGRCKSRRFPAQRALMTAPSTIRSPEFASTIFPRCCAGAATT